MKECMNYTGNVTDNDYVNYHEFVNHSEFPNLHKYVNHQEYLNHYEYINQNEYAIIVLHEIYGINQHIEHVCKQYFNQGYDIFCPDFIQARTAFDYSEVDQAYQYFINNIGFDVYKNINALIHDLSKRYKKIFLIGFSVGATVAWRCTPNSNLDGVIGYYGSRIRDYMNIIPQCPTLLIFANEDSFDVTDIVQSLEKKPLVTTSIIDGKHGFLDKYSNHYKESASVQTQIITEQFLNNIIVRTRKEVEELNG